MRRFPVSVFVFWSYDLFPYVLGAEADELREDGAYHVPSYQFWVGKPLKILPVAEGKKLLGRLETLKSAKLEKDRQTNELFLQELKILMPEAVERFA